MPFGFAQSERCMHVFGKEVELELVVCPQLVCFSQFMFKGMQKINCECNECEKVAGICCHVE